jgi:hypothetical protein
MKSILRMLAVLLLCVQIHAQTTQAPNEVPICSATCTVTGTSLATALLQFGSPGAATEVTWGPLFTMAAFPQTVSYTNYANLGGINPPADAKGDDDVLEAKQATVAYTVSWLDSGGNPQTTAVPALVGNVVLGGIVLNYDGVTYTCILTFTPGTVPTMAPNCTAAPTP